MEPELEWTRLLSNPYCPERRQNCRRNMWKCPRPFPEWAALIMMDSLLLEPRDGGFEDPDRDLDKFARNLKAST